MNGITRTFGQTRLHGHVGLVVSCTLTMFWTCSAKKPLLLPKSSCMRLCNGFLPFQTLSSSTFQNTLIIRRRTASSFTINNERHNPPLPNPFIIHTSTSSSFAINNTCHYPPHPLTFQTLSSSTRPNNLIVHTGLVYHEQRTSLPPRPTPIQTLSSSTKKHHLRLQSTTNVITPSTKH